MFLRWSLEQQDVNTYARIREVKYIRWIITMFYKLESVVADPEQGLSVYNRIYTDIDV